MGDISWWWQFPNDNSTFWSKVKCITWNTIRAEKINRMFVFQCNIAISWGHKTKGRPRRMTFMSVFPTYCVPNAWEQGVSVGNLREKYITLYDVLVLNTFHNFDLKYKYVCSLKTKCMFFCSFISAKLIIFILSTLTYLRCKINNVFFTCKRV